MLSQHEEGGTNMSPGRHGGGPGRGSAGADALVAAKSGNNNQHFTELAYFLRLCHMLFQQFSNFLVAKLNHLG